MLTIIDKKNPSYKKGLRYTQSRKGRCPGCRKIKILNVIETPEGLLVTSCSFRCSKHKGLLDDQQH